MASNGTSATTNSGFTPLNLTDLQDPTLWRLNTTFQRLTGQIGTLLTPGGSPSYPVTPAFQTATATNQSEPPTNPNEFITRGSADQLYGPAAQRTALLTGSYPGGNTSQVQASVVQPIPPSSSAGTVSGSGATVKKVLLAANTLITSPGAPSSDGQLLVVAVSQDATGHHTITWDAPFKGAPINISGTPSTTNMFWFVGLSSSWWLAAVPVFGTAGTP